MEAMLLRAKVAILRRRLEQVRAEVVELKQELHEEVDARKREQEVQAELDAAQEGQRNLATLCCYGAPNWEGGDEDGEDGVWGPWLEGKEVLYRPALAWQSGSSTSTCSMADAGSSARSDGGLLKVVQASKQVRLQIYRQPFALGGVRMAKYARDDAVGRYVVKQFLVEHPKLKRRLMAAHLDAHAMAICQAAAQSFCQAAAEAGEDGGQPSISFLPGSVVVLNDESRPGGKLVLLKEPYLDQTSAASDSSGSSSSRVSQGNSASGSCSCSSATSPQWMKWTRNDGHVLQADGVIEAFTHFSLLHSKTWLGHECMILDAQGIRQEAGSGQTCYLLTDPALCSADGRCRYGTTDTGDRAVKLFMQDHKCSAMCRRVPPLRSIDLGV